jgi:Acetokinase family
MAGGRSVPSTMGFTAIDGLPMGTRCGSLDPAVILYLIDERGMDIRAIERLLYTESGLLGLSGISSDMRTPLTRDIPRARLAIDVDVYRIRRELGSLAAALGGSTLSCSRRESARTRRRSADGSAGMPRGRGWPWTRGPTRRAAACAKGDPD